MNKNTKNKHIQEDIKKWNLDAYEVDVLMASDEGNIQNTIDEMTKYQNIARYSVDQRKKKAINIRLGIGDISLVKRKAKRDGIPYQTLISSVIHKYATGQLMNSY